MTANEGNVEEMVENLILMFPGVSKAECQDYLHFMSFDDAADILSVSFSEMNQDKSQADAVQSTLSTDEKADMVRRLTQNFSDLDEEIANDILEESNFDYKKAMLIAEYNQNLYDQVLKDNSLEKLKSKYRNVDDMVIFNCLEAANFDFSLASSLIEETFQNQDASFKKSKKKSKQVVISENAIPVATQNRPNKSKNKTKKPKLIPSVKTAPPPDSNTEIMNENVTTLKELFDHNPSFTDRDYIEVLKLSKNDLNHAFNILNERLSMFELSNDFNNANQNQNAVTENSKLRQLIELFPLIPTEKLNETLQEVNGDTKQAIAKLVEYQPTFENLLKSPSIDENENEGNEIFWKMMPKQTKTTGKVNKSNRMPDRPLQGHRTKTKEVDLHGYTAQQASAIVEQYLNDAKYNDLRVIIFVTGYGKHSHNNIAVLKPLVKRLCKHHGYTVVNSSNPGAVNCIITD